MSSVVRRQVALLISGWAKACASFRCLFYFALAQRLFWIPIIFPSCLYGAILGRLNGMS